MEYRGFIFQEANSNPSSMFINLKPLPLEGPTKVLATQVLIHASVVKQEKKACWYRVIIMPTK